MKHNGLVDFVLFTAAVNIQTPCCILSAAAATRLHSAHSLNNQTANLVVLFYGQCTLETHFLLTHMYPIGGNIV